MLPRTQTSRRQASARWRSRQSRSSLPSGLLVLFLAIAIHFRGGHAASDVRVTAVTPCAGTGGIVTIHGTNFGALDATEIRVGPYNVTSHTRLSGTMIEATFPAGLNGPQKALAHHTDGAGYMVQVLAGDGDDDGVEYYFSMDENADTAEDHSIAGLQPALTRPTGSITIRAPCDCMSGRCRKFAGDGYYRSPSYHASTIQNLNDLSISFYLRVDLNGNKHLVGSCKDSADDKCLAAVRLRNNRGLKYTASYPGGNLQCDIDWVLQVDQWHHVAVTHEGSNGHINIYVDGVNVKYCNENNGNPRTLAGSDSTLPHFTIGGAPDDYPSGSSSTGEHVGYYSIDEVVVVNRLDSLAGTHLFYYQRPNPTFTSVTPFSMGLPTGGYTVTFTGSDFDSWNGRTLSTLTVAGQSCTSPTDDGNNSPVLECGIPDLTAVHLAGQATLGATYTGVAGTSATLPGCAEVEWTNQFAAFGGCGDNMVQMPEECDTGPGDGSSGCLSDCTIDTTPTSSSVTCNAASTGCTCSGSQTFTQADYLTGDTGGQWRTETNARCTSGSQECNARQMVTGQGWYVDSYPQPLSETARNDPRCAEDHTSDRQLRNVFRADDIWSYNADRIFEPRDNDCDLSSNQGDTAAVAYLAGLFLDKAKTATYDFNDDTTTDDDKNTILIVVNFMATVRLKTIMSLRCAGSTKIRHWYTAANYGYGTAKDDFLKLHQENWISVNNKPTYTTQLQEYPVGGVHGAPARSVLLQMGETAKPCLRYLNFEFYATCTDGGPDCTAGSPSDCTRTYNAITVTGVTPTSADWDSGDWITVTGTNFGEGFASEAPLVKIGTMDCFATQFLSISEMACQTPINPATGPGTFDLTLELTGVTVTGGAATGSNLFTIANPGPSTLTWSPTTGSCLGNEGTTLTGTNFRAVTLPSDGITRYLVPESIGGTLLGAVNRQSATEIHLSSPPGVGGNRDVVFKYCTQGAIYDVVPWGVDGQWQTRQNFDGYADRTWMQPGASTAGWATTNSELNSWDVSKVAYARIEFNNPGLMEITKFRFKYDDGARVFLNGVEIFTSPECTACDATTWPAGGNHATDSDFVSSIDWSPLQSGTNCIAVIAYDTHGGDLKIDLDMEAQVFTADASLSAYSITLSDYDYDLPTITARDPTNGYDPGGYVISLDGACFGHIDHGSTTVSLDGNNCGSYTWISDTKIECIVPSGSGTNKDIFVTVAGQTNAAAAKFDYNGAPPTPVVSSLDPSSAYAAAGGGDITIVGTNFALWASAGNQIAIGGSNCTSISGISNTHILCSGVPAGTGVSLQVAVTVGTIVGTNNIFDYKPPDPTGVSSSVPGAGGGTVTITGVDFGGPGVGSNPLVWINGAPCTTPTLQSDTALRCDVPAGGGGNLNVTVCVTDQCTYNRDLTIYDSPTVSAVTQVGTLGGTITITGTNFGVDSTRVTVDVNSANCPVTALAITEVVCTAAEGAGRDLPVAVTVGGDTATSGSIFSYEAPVVTATDPPDASPLGGVDITVVGANFGPTGTTKVAAYFGGTVCASPTVDNHTRLVCTLPAGFGPNIAVDMYEWSGVAVAKQSLTFTLGCGGEDTGEGYDKATDNDINTKWRSQCAGTVCTACTTCSNCMPHVNYDFGGMRVIDYVRYYPPCGGNEWRVEDGEWHASTDSAYANYMTTYKENSTPSCAWQIGTSTDSSNLYRYVRYQNMPWNSGFSQWWYAEMAETQWWTFTPRVGSASVFSYSPPDVTLADPVVGDPVGGFKLTISGANFGPASTPATVELAGFSTYTCANAAVVSDTLMYCDVPPGFGVAMSVDVTIYGQQNTANNLYNYALPDLWNISPFSGPAAGGYTITIYGDNLAPGVNGYVDGSRCTTTIPSSSTVMFCIAPPGVGTARHFHIKPGVDMNIAVNTSSTLLFSYDPPDITAVSGSPKRAVGGDTVTISGQGYGPAGTYVEIFLNGTACATSTHLSDSEIECVLPQGIGTDIFPTVNISAQWGSQISGDPMSYDIPLVTSLDPNKSPSTGGDITILGSNFGVAVGPDGYSATVQGTVCTALAHISDSEILCTTPSGYGGALDVRVIAAKQVNVANTLFSYDNPTVTSVTPNSGNTMGGFEITLTGNHYGVSGESTVNAQVDGQACTYVSHTNTEIVCLAPNHAGQALSVTVTTQGTGVAALSSTPNNLFSFDSPTIASIDPTSGNTVGAYTLTVFGTNYGPSGTEVGVTLGSNECTGSTVVHDSELTCTVPPGAGSDHYVHVYSRSGIEQLNGTTNNLFTYNAPTVGSINPAAGDCDGGQVIEISGTQYGPIGTPVAASVSGTDCLVAVVTSDSTLDCTVPPGIGVAHDILVTIPDLGNSQVGAAAGGLDLFTYDIPLVTGVNPNEQPGAGGATITVTGKNFGVDIATAVLIEIGGTTCNNVNHVSDTIVTCEIPLGFGADVNIDVEVATQNSVPNTLWTYQRPIVTKVTPNSGLAIGGFNITIEGSNFGLPIPVAAPFLTPELNNVSCTYKFHTDTLLVCLAPPGVGTLLSADVVLKGARNDPNQLFTYAPPSFTEITPATGPTAGGYTISLEGANFGPPGTPATVLIGSRTSTACTSTNDILIECLSADGSGSSHDVILTVGGQTDTLVDAFSYLPPTIVSITPDQRKTNGGQWMTVTGTNFGPHDSGPGTPATVAVGGTNCQSTVHLSDTSVACQVPEGQGVGKVVSITLPIGFGNALSANSATPLFTYRPPDVTMVTPNEQTTLGGSTVTVEGTNFGAAGSTVLVTIGGSTCGSPTVLNHEEVRCITPAGIGRDIPIDVTLATQVNGAPKNFWTYQRPTVDILNPASSPAIGGMNVTITGTSFGPSGTVPTASIGARACTNALWLSQTQVMCIIPAGVGLNLPVRVTIASNVNPDNALFTYDPPTVSAISLQNGPTRGISWVTLTGTNFGPAGSANSITVGGIACQNPTANVISDTRVKCRVPAGIGYNRDVVIDALGQSATLSDAWTYDPPTVSFVIPNTGATAGGYYTTIYGSNFGPSGTPVDATLGGVTCTTTTHLNHPSHDRIRCQVPAGAGGGKSVTVLIGNGVAPGMEARLAARGNRFTYDPPGVSGVIPTTLLSNTIGGFTFTVQGSNFGSAVEGARVLVGGSYCSPTTHISDSLLECSSPSGTGTSHAVQVELGGAASPANPSIALKYFKPVVTGITPDNLDTVGGLVTITGNYFGPQDFSRGHFLTVSFDLATDMGVNSGAGPFFDKTEIDATFDKFSWPAAATAYGGYFIDSRTLKIGILNDPRAPVSMAAMNAVTIGCQNGQTNVRNARGDTAFSCEDDISGNAYASPLPGQPANPERYVDPPYIMSIHVQDPPAYNAWVDNGDLIVFTFSAPTNKPAVNNKNEIFKWIDWVNGVDQYGTGLSGAWNAAGDVLTLEITNWISTTPIMPGSSPCTLKDTDPGEYLTHGDPMIQSSKSTMPCPILQGSFDNDASTPVHQNDLIVSIRASSDTNLPGEDGVTPGDIITVRFGQPMSPIAVNSKTSIDNLFTFSESLGTDYTGSWQNGNTELRIELTETSGHENPTIGTFTMTPTVGNFVPAVSSLAAPPVTGDWGTTSKRPQPYMLAYDHYNATCTAFSCYEDYPPAFIDGSRCTDSLWVDDAMIICVAPRGTGILRNVTVDIASQLSNDTTSGDQLFTYNPPTLTGYYPEGAFTDGTSNITIIGTNFGFEPALDWISINGSMCQAEAFLNNTHVICQVPVGSGIDLEIKVQIDAQVDITPNTYFTYGRPIVYEIVPPTGKTINILPPDPDTSDLIVPYLVTIVGRNFGPPDGAQTYNISIGDQTCLDFTHINDTAVTCYPKGGVGVGLFPKIDFNGQANTGNTTWKYWTYDRPIITRVSPNSGRKKGGALITIYGENFGEFWNPVTVEISGVPCEDPIWISNFEMTCVTGKLAVFTIGTGAGGTSTQVYVGTQTNDPNNFFAYLDFTDPICREPAVREYPPGVKTRQQLPIIPRYFNSISSRAYNITTVHGGVVNFPSELGDNDRCCKKAGETGGVCGVQFAPPANVSAPNVVEVIVDLGSMAQVTGVYTSWFQPCQNEPNPFYDIDYWDGSAWQPLLKHVTLSSDSPCDVIAGDLGPVSLCVDYFTPLETTQMRMTFDNQKLYPAGEGFMTEFEVHGIFLDDPLYLRPVIPPDQYTQLSDFNVSWDLIAKTDNVNFLHLGPTDIMTQTVQVQLVAVDVDGVVQGTVIPLISNITIDPTEAPFLNQTTNRTTGWTHFEGMSTYAPKKGKYRLEFVAEPTLDFRADLAMDPVNPDFFVYIVPGAPTQLLVNILNSTYYLRSEDQTRLPKLEVIAADPAGNYVLISNWTYGSVSPSADQVPLGTPSGDHELVLGRTEYDDLYLERPRRGTHIVTFTSNTTMGSVSYPFTVNPGPPHTARVKDPPSRYREYISNEETPLGFIEVELLDAGGDPTANDRTRDFWAYNLDASDPVLTSTSGSLRQTSGSDTVIFGNLILLNPPKQNWTIGFKVSTAEGANTFITPGNFTTGILIGVPTRPLFDVDPTPYRSSVVTNIQNYTVYAVDAGDNRVLYRDPILRTCTVSVNSTERQLGGLTSKIMREGVVYFDDLVLHGPPQGRYYVTTQCSGLKSSFLSIIDVIPGDPVALSVYYYNATSDYYAAAENDIDSITIQTIDAGDNFAGDWGWNGTLVKVTSNSTLLTGILNNTLSAGLTYFHNVTFLNPLSMIHVLRFDAVGLAPAYLGVKIEVGIPVGLIVHNPVDVAPIYPTQVYQRASEFNVTFAPPVQIRVIDAGGNHAITTGSIDITATSNTTTLYDDVVEQMLASTGAVDFDKLTSHRPAVANHTITFSSPGLDPVDIILWIDVGNAYTLAILYWNTSITYTSTDLTHLARIQVGAVDPGYNFAPATSPRQVSVAVDGVTAILDGVTAGTLTLGDIDFGLPYGQEDQTPYKLWEALGNSTNATAPPLLEGEKHRLGFIKPKARVHTLVFSAPNLLDATLEVQILVGVPVKLKIPPHLLDTTIYRSSLISPINVQEVWAMDAGDNHNEDPQYDGNVLVSITSATPYKGFEGSFTRLMVNGTVRFTDLVLKSATEGKHRFHFESQKYVGPPSPFSFWETYDHEITFVIGDAIVLSIPNPAAVVQNLAAEATTNLLDIPIAAQDAGGSLLKSLDPVNRTISVTLRTTTGTTLEGTFDQLMYRGEADFLDLAVLMPKRDTYYLDFETPGLDPCNVTIVVGSGPAYRLVFSDPNGWVQLNENPENWLYSSVSDTEILRRVMKVRNHDASGEVVPIVEDRLVHFCVRLRGDNTTFDPIEPCKGESPVAFQPGQITSKRPDQNDVSFPAVVFNRPKAGNYSVIFYSIDPLPMLVSVSAPIEIRIGDPLSLEVTKEDGISPVKMQYKARERVDLEAMRIYALDAAGTRVLVQDIRAPRNMTIRLENPAVPADLEKRFLGYTDKAAGNGTGAASILVGPTKMEMRNGEVSIEEGEYSFDRPKLTLSNNPHTLVFTIPDIEPLKLPITIVAGDPAKLRFVRPDFPPTEHEETAEFGKALNPQPRLAITDELYNDLTDLNGWTVDEWKVEPLYPSETVRRPEQLDLSPPVSENGILTYTGLEMLGRRDETYVMTWTIKGLLPLQWNVSIIPCEISKQNSQVMDDGINCECKAGYTADEAKTGCAPCQDGQYKDRPGVAPCESCPDKMDTLLQKASTSRSACRCQSGYYNKPGTGSGNSTAECLVCPEGASCPGGTEITQIAGYWRSSNESDLFYKCVGTACLGGEQRCAAGHKPDGPLCDVCEERHGKFGTTCEPCPEASYSLLIFLVTAALLIAHMLLVIKTANSDRSKTAVMQKILLNYLQVLSLVGGFAVEWPPALRGMFQASEGTSSVSFRMISVECSTTMDTFQIFYAQISFPAVFIACVFVFNIVGYGIRKIISGLKGSASMESFGDALRSCIVPTLVVIFMTHPTVSKEVFNMFNCLTLDENGEPVRYLVIDLSQRCDTPKYQEVRNVAMIMLFTVCLGVPLYGFLLLNIIKHNLTKTSIVNKFGFMYIGLKHETYYWEMTIILRKIGIVACSVFLREDPQLQVYVAMWVMQASLVGHLYLNPYVNQTCHNLEFGSLSAIFVTLYCIIMYNNGGLSPFVMNLVTYGLWLTNGGVGATLVFVFVKNKIAMKRAMKRNTITMGELKEVTSGLMDDVDAQEDLWNGMVEKDLGLKKVTDELFDDQGVRDDLWRSFQFEDGEADLVHISEQVMGNELKEVREEFLKTLYDDDDDTSEIVKAD